MDRPPHPYETAMMQPTSVAEERRSTNTAIGKSERPRPRTPPVAQSNAPIKGLPLRIEYRDPLDHIQNEPSRKPSNQTLSDSNAAHPRSAQQTTAPTSTSIESERPRPRTPPMAQSNEPIKDQPALIEYRHPLDHTRNGPPRMPSNQIPLGGNAGVAAGHKHEAKPAQTRPPTSTRIEMEKPRPGTLPVAPSYPPIEDQPVTIEYRDPLDHTLNGSPRMPSNQIPLGGNAVVAAGHNREAKPAQARPPTSTRIEMERPRPGTPPVAQSNPPIEDQPVPIENRRPLDHTLNGSPRMPSNQISSGGN